MPYPSPADEERNGGCGPILAAVVLLFIVLAAASCASQAMGAQDVTVRQARTDGPIYDLPEGIGQEIVCDEHNREYLLLTTEQGGVFLMPYMDEDGEQEIMPRPRTQRSRPVWSGFFLSDEQYERPPNDEHAYVFAY